MRPRFTPLVVVVALAALVALAWTARPAVADTPRTADCTAFAASRTADPMIAWMNGQLAAGRMGFVSPNPGVLCAW